MFSYRRLLAAASLLGLAAAQVSTSCNPLNATCPPDPGFGTDYTWNFNATPSYELWEVTAGTVQYDNENGAAFTIAKEGDSPTIRTTFYIFFGRTEVWLKVAPGVGIVSSTMMLSDDLDEIDWEFLGATGTSASTNYFGKGIQNFDNADVYPVQGGTVDDFHNYTTVWTQEQLEWWIDGTLVRTLTAEQANNTKTYPQTPMRLSIGIWAGGAPGNPIGTVEWAGGNTSYADGPYTMYVKSCQITDYSSGKQYIYGNMSGDWQSIQVVSGNSTAYEALHPVPTVTLADKWNALPTAAKAGVYVGGGLVGAAVVGSVLFFCLRQRRMGAREALHADEMEKSERMELGKMDNDGAASDPFGNYTTEYESQLPKKDGNVDGVTITPLAKTAWNRNVESPLQSPVPFLQDDSHALRASSPPSGRFRDTPSDESPFRDGPTDDGPFRDAPADSPFHDVHSSEESSQFDFGLAGSAGAVAAPARAPSPALMRPQSPAASSQNRLSSGSQRVAQVRHFSVSHMGYQGVPLNDS